MEVYGISYFEGAASSGDIGKQIIELKIVYLCSDLSDMAIFQDFYL